MGEVWGWPGVNGSFSPLCSREGNVSTKQIVFLQRPCLPQKIKKKESKVSDLDGLFQFSLAGLPPQLDFL